MDKSLPFVFRAYVDHFLESRHFFVSINYYNQSFWKQNRKKIISMHPNTSKSVAQLKKKKPVKFNKLRTNLCARRAPSSAAKRRCPLAPPCGAPLQYTVLTILWPVPVLQRSTGVEVHRTELTAALLLQLLLPHTAAILVATLLLLHRGGGGGGGGARGYFQYTTSSTTGLLFFHYGTFSFCFIHCYINTQFIYIIFVALL